MEAISREEFAQLRRVLPAITPSHLFETYRISETTWRKLRDGQPVKITTLQRIRERYAEQAPMAERG